MKYLSSNIFYALLLNLILSFSAQATLMLRADGATVYDSDLNITWLSNANLALTNTFGVTGINASSGRMSWDTANSWISAMNAANYLGTNNWRLPSTDITCSGANCTASEFGHLFYSELGLQSGAAITSADTTTISNFTNLQTIPYWTAEEFANDDKFAWQFKTSTGEQVVQSKGFNFYAIAVFDGDLELTAVPIPASVWLFVSALLAIQIIGRKKPAASVLS